MKPEKQRIAIAEACGWKMHDHPDCLAKKEGWVSRGWETWVMNPSGLLVFKHDIPKYLNDLNAMHQAEKVLTKNKSMEYAFRLADSWILNGEDKQPDLVRGFCATAAERAEAFLKTIGKWEEEA
jgi:hypothetical protein